MQVLVARNCHKSVYHAIYMNELEPVLSVPGVSGQDIRVKYGNFRKRSAKLRLKSIPEIRAVIIVSPTYDGVRLGCPEELRRRFTSRGFR